MTAVTGDRIGRSGVTGMQGLDSLVSGMTVTNLGPGRNKILLRGISDGVFTGLTQSTVGLYLDLTPITYSAPDPDLKLIDIDRVEVLRGPQGTLYGTGPIGGVVRIVTRRPEFGREDLAVALTRSHTHGGGTNTDYNIVANLPLAGDRAAIRAAVYGETFSGYINGRRTEPAPRQRRHAAGRPAVGRPGPGAGMDRARGRRPPVDHDRGHPLRLSRPGASAPRQSGARTASEPLRSGVAVAGGARDLGPSGRLAFRRRTWVQEPL